VHDEIEDLTRRLAKRAYLKGLMKPSRGASPPTINTATDPWARVARALMNNFDARAAGSPQLWVALFAKIVGITPHRNDSGHKPGDIAALRRRDKELRTRFESAVDLLKELLDASKPLRI
jgi:hypothetical protein